MADHLAGQRNDPRYPGPLSAIELRAMYRRNRSPEVRALLWEIARLHSIVRRADQLLSCFPASAGTSTATALDIVIGALRRELQGEPCLAEVRRLREEEAWSTKRAAEDPWAMQREARRRRNT